MDKRNNVHQADFSKALFKMSRQVNKKGINVPYMALIMWIAETLDYCDSIGDGIGPIIIDELKKSMKIEEIMNPHGKSLSNEQTFRNESDNTLLTENEQFNYWEN